MSFQLSAILSLVIGIPAIIGLVKFKRLEKSFRPFIALLWVGFINEVISIYCIYEFGNNMVNYNFFILAEIMLILWQFRSWKLFTHYKVYVSLQIMVVIAWCTETLYINNIYSLNRYSLILFSFIIVVCAIFQVAFMIFSHTNKLLQHATFIICIAFIVFFSYTIIAESIGLYGLQLSKDFRVEVQTLFVYVNLFTNLLFILAVIWMPTKLRYLMQLQ
ncbi:MAG: hypothetical protein H0V30_06015 [Chitinophagaceae bacterium]|nr:hypothetical protein [Chitinophagaceae bacterium]